MHGQQNIFGHPIGDQNPKTYSSPGDYWLGWQEQLGNGSNNTAAIAGTANQVRAILVYLNRRLLLDQLSVRPTANGTGIASFGIYSRDGQNLILSSGGIATTGWSGSGVQIYRLPLWGVIDSGYYWWAWTADNTAATATSGAFDGNSIAAINTTGVLIGTGINSATGGILPPQLGPSSAPVSGSGANLTNFPIWKLFKG